MHEPRSYLLMLLPISSVAGVAVSAVTITPAAPPPMLDEGLVSLTKHEFRPTGHAPMRVMEDHAPTGALEESVLWSTGRKLSTSTQANIRLGFSP